jgi:hypothetical protein
MLYPQFVNKSVTLPASQAQKFRVIYISRDLYLQLGKKHAEL